MVGEGGPLDRRAAHEIREGICSSIQQKKRSGR